MTDFEDSYRQLSDAQRQLLDAWLAAEPPAAARPPHAEPRSPVERTLAQVWQDVLEVDRIGIDDDYVTLGGDSIHAIVVVARAEAAGVRITPHDLLEERTIRRLAALAEPAGRGAVAMTEPGAVPLSPLQEGMLFHTLAADRPVYLVQLSCELSGDLDPGVFHAAWQAVVQRHSALRASFHCSGDGPACQRVDEHAPLPLRHEDWRAWPPAEQQRLLREFLAADAAIGFDLGRAPLLRLALLRTGDGVHRVVWTHHHLLLDGWSQQLVLADVLDAYGALRAGRSPDVPAREHRGAVAADPAAADRFWRDYLAGYAGRAPMPRAVPGAPAAGLAAPPIVTGPVVTGPIVAEPVVTELHERATAALTAWCREHGLTTADAVLGGWGLLLAATTGTGDVVFGATVSGRSAATAGIVDAVGMFINTLPVRARPRPEQQLLSWLRELHAEQLAARRHEHTPLPRIARSAAVAPGHALFDTIVVLENFPAPLPAAGPVATGLTVADVRVTVDEGYPLVLEATPSQTLRLRARFDPACYDPDRVHGLLAALRELLAGLPVLAAHPLSVATAKLRERLHRQSLATRSALHEDAAHRLRHSRRQPVAGVPAQRPATAEPGGA